MIISKLQYQENMSDSERELAKEGDSSLCQAAIQ